MVFKSAQSSSESNNGKKYNYLFLMDIPPVNCLSGCMSGLMRYFIVSLVCLCNIIERVRTDTLRNCLPTPSCGKSKSEIIYKI